jgi:chromosome segregation ATPase
MSQPDTTDLQKQSAPQIDQASTGTRVDPAHQIAKQEGITAAVGDAAAEKPLPDEAVAEQLHVQADQLASHLRAQQKQLDHRQAELNAQIAQLERDARTARLWLGEREAELDRRSRELDQQQREVEGRLARLAAADAARRNQADTPDAKGQTKAAAPGPELLAREEVLRRTAEALEAKRRQLDEAEARLADAKAETQELQRQVSETRREAQEERRSQGGRLAAEQRRALAELQQRRQAVERRSEHVDRCRTALEQLREELTRMHGETLELRLATEELWAELSGAAPPAALTRSLGRIRSKLADHYRLMDADLKQQKNELETIRGELAEQHEKLARQKREFQQWAARRQEGIDKQAARLVAREEQLRQKEAELTDQAHRWQAERLQDREEIRRLRSQLSAPDDAAVLA